jgi:hypothetical protein
MKGFWLYVMPLFLHLLPVLWRFCPKKSLPIPVSWSISPLFSFPSLPLKSLIPFQLIFITSKR